MTATGRWAAIHTRHPACVVLFDALAAEWAKLRSLRSTYWILLVAAVTAVGGSCLVASTAARTGHSPFDPLEGIFFPWLEYPVLAVGLLGLLVFTSEYATVQIRTTLSAVPQRGVVLAAKAGSVGALALCLGEVLAFCCFLLSQAILAGHHGLSLSHPAVAGAVAAAGFTLFAIAITGVALGVITRHTAGAVAALLAVIYLPLALLSLPAPWGDRVGRFSILAAASQTVSLHPQATLLSPAFSMLVVAAWPTMALFVAAILFARRDA